MGQDGGAFTLSCLQDGFMYVSRRLCSGGEYIPSGSLQAFSTQEVEAFTMTGRLALEHWHQRSLGPQVVESAMALAIHIFAQYGI